MRKLLTLAALAVLTNACLPSGLSAKGHTREIAHLINRFSLGAGYEYCAAAWESDAFVISSGRIDQGRFYIRGGVVITA